MSLEGLCCDPERTLSSRSIGNHNEYTNSAQELRGAEATRRFREQGGRDWASGNS